MTFYWYTASLKLGLWFVEAVSQRCYPTVQNAIEDGFRQLPDDCDNDDPTTAFLKIALLIGKNTGKPIRTKRHKWRWILVTDPYNNPGYIVKLSSNSYSCLLDCVKNALHYLKKMTPEPYPFNNTVFMFRKF